MTTQKEVCKICNNFVNKTRISDPVYFKYNCSNCGRYILLEQIYCYPKAWQFKTGYQKLSQLINNYKIENKDIDLCQTYFVIGPEELLLKFENSDICKQLKDEGNNLVNIKYSLLGDADD